MNNYEIFKKYCSIVHPDGKNYFAIYGNGQPIQIANVPATEETFNTLKEYNEQGYDIYTVVQESVGFKDDDVRSSRWYIADWDAGRGSDGKYYSDTEVRSLKDIKLLELKQWVKDGKMLMPTLVVESRNGFHMYWEVSDPSVLSWEGDMKKDLGELDRFKVMNVYRATILSISKHLKTDPIIINPARILRVPGLNWMKTTEGLSPSLTTIKLYNSNNIYTSRQIIDVYPLDEECKALAMSISRGKSNSRISSNNGNYSSISAGKWYIVHNNGSKSADGKSYIEVDAEIEQGQLHAGCSIGNDPKQHDIVIRSGDWAFCNACNCGCYATENGDELFEVKTEKLWLEIKSEQDYTNLTEEHLKTLQSSLEYKGSSSTTEEYFNNIIGKKDDADDEMWDGDDNLFVDTPSEIDFDHTERALENFLMTKKDTIETDLKEMLGNRYYNYLDNMATQIGIQQKDVIPFFTYNCVGVLTGNAVTAEWITNYDTYLNTFSCVNAMPGSGKSPLQDVFIKGVKNKYENSEAIAIAKRQLSALDVSTDSNVAASMVDDFDFTDEVGTNDTIPPKTQVPDYDNVACVEDEAERHSFILDNTTPEARASVMSKCGYAFQVGSELTQYMSGKYADPSDQAAEQNKYYSGSSVNVNRVGRANEKVPNCCMSILTEGQNENVQNLYSSNFVGMGFTPRFDIIKMGRRSSKLSRLKADPKTKRDFEDIMLAFADNRLIVSNKNDDVVIDQSIDERHLVNEKCLYKGEQHIILHSKYMGNYYHLLLSRVMKPLNDDVANYIVSRHKNELERVIGYSNVVSRNIDCFLQKTTERLLKYIGITSLIRYTFGRKSYIDYDKTDVNIAINYYYYALYHNMTNEYKIAVVDKDMQKIIKGLYKIFKDDGNNTSKLDWSKFSNTQLVRKNGGRNNFRDNTLKETEKHGFFKEVVDGKKLSIVMLDRKRIENYLDKGVVK